MTSCLKPPDSHPLGFSVIPLEPWQWLSRYSFRAMCNGVDLQTFGCRDENHSSTMTVSPMAGCIKGPLCLAVVTNCGDFLNSCDGKVRSCMGTMWVDSKWHGQPRLCLS